MLRAGQCGWFSQAVPVLLLSASMSTSSDAQALRFGPSGAGGSGTWDNAAANWFDGSTAVPWASGAVALFGGTAGTVTASGTVAASGITFSTSGYTMTGGTLALSGIAPVVTTNAGVSTTINSLLTGPSVLVKSGAGTLTLGNASNAYTGGTIVSQGSLVFGGNSALGTGTVTLGDVNTGASNVSLLANFPNFSTGQTIQNNIIVSGSGSGTVSIGSTSFNPGSNGTIYSGTITLNRDLTIIGGNADRTSFSGKISGTGNITVTGNRVTLSSNANDFVGTLTITPGNVLQLDRAGVLPGTATLNILGGGVLQFANNSDLTIDGLNGSQTAVMRIITGGPPKLAVGASSGSGVYAGQIGNVISSFTKLGGGAQVLSGANTYLGVTRISGGLLSTQLLANGGVASGIGASSNAAANLVLDGGRLQYTGAGANTDRQFTLTTNGGGLDASGSGAVNFTSTAAIALGGAGPRTLALAGSSTAANTLNAVLGDSGGSSSLLKTGIGRWVLTGNQSYAGETTIAQGTLALSGAASVANSARVVADGTFDISAVTPASASIRSLAGNGSVALGTKTLTVTNANDTFAGSITDIGGLTVSAGTQTLTGMSNYTGTTTANGTGNLQILNGGQVTGTSSTILDGVNAKVTATVSGTGSLLQTGTLFVGGNSGSDATLNVLNGGVVRRTTFGTTFIAGSGGKTATINVDGTGSLLDLNGALNVATAAMASSGFLNITNGGVVRSTAGSVGTIFAGTGKRSLAVSGTGSSWTMTGALTLQSDASMSVLNGGAVNAATSTIGSSLSGGPSNLLVSGTGSTFSVTGNQVVGATSGSGIVTLADGARMTVGGQLTLASSAGAAGVLNIGSGEGQAATGAGMLDAATLAFGPGTGRLNFNHTDAGYVFNTSVTGNGAINHNGPGTTIWTSDSSGFTGPTTVSNGSFIVNGSLSGSALTVQSGARLGGSGTVGASTLASGSRITPGNSIGTLTINGAYVQGAGSVYEVELDPKTVTSDLIRVNGQATLATGATLSIVNYTGGGFVAGQRYTILTSTGLTGNYGSDDYVIGPLLSLRKGTDAFNAYLAVIQTGTAAGAGTTPNEVQVGDSVDSLPAGNAVQTGVYNQASLDAVRGALGQLGGEIYASTKSALINESWLLRSAVNDRLRSAFGAVGAAPMATMNYGFTADLAPSVTGPMPRLMPSDRFAAWGQGYGSWSRHDGDGNSSPLKHSTGGFVLGADVAAFETLRLGVVAGYSRTTVNVDRRLSSSESDNYHLGLYGGGQWGPLGLRLGASYTWHDIETRRSVVAAGLGTSLRADHDAGTAQVFGELGYRIDLGPVAFEPFAGLAYVSLRSDGLSEVGGAAALSGTSDDTSLGYSTLGLRASTSTRIQGMDLSLRGALGWRHAFGDVDPKATLAFAGSIPFTITGAPIARNAALVEAGLDLAISANASLGVTYAGQLAEDIQDHAFKANLAVRF